MPLKYITVDDTYNNHYTDLETHKNIVVNKDAVGIG